MKTSTEKFNKQVPVAIAALGQHMFDHDLPIPMSIEIREEDEQIIVRVPSEGAQAAWLRTVQVESEVNVGSGDDRDDWVRTTWAVRLPSLGIACTLSGWRRVPYAVDGNRALTVVSA